MKKFFRKAVMFIYILIKKMDDDELIALSAQLSYSFVLAFFPFFIFLMTVIGFLRLDSQQVLIFLETLLPNEVYFLIQNIVKFVIDSREGSLLSLSLFLSIWSSSAGFRGVMRGLNKAYNVVDSLYNRTCSFNYIDAYIGRVWRGNRRFIREIFCRLC